MSLLASLARPLWRLLNDQNIDARALFTQAGLDPDLIEEPRARFPHGNLRAAWQEAAQALGRPHIGLMTGQYLRVMDLNALGATFLSSANLRDAAHRLIRYEQVLNTQLSFHVEEQDDLFHLVSELKGSNESGVAVNEDGRHAALMNLIGRALDKDTAPVEVGFTYPEPRDLADHYSVFRCKLSFEEPAPRLTFRAADAHKPFTGANREFAQRTDVFLDEMLSELNADDLVGRVKKVIIDALPSGAPTEEDVARYVFVSSRTLQRRLAEQGTNFRKLLLEVRRELAERYISDKNMPLAEISYMLGFADSSSFSRAFKRWTGDPPAVFRQKLTG